MPLINNSMILISLIAVPYTSTLFPYLTSISINGLFKHPIWERYNHLKAYKSDSCPISRKNIEEFDRKLFHVIDDYYSKDIREIAISCPGAVDTKKGIIYNGGSFPFQHNVNLKKKLADHYNIDVAIENDGRCAALAELWLGSIKGKQDAVVLVLGSGVGGGIILNGKIRHGGNLLSGELSFVMSGMSKETNEATFVGFEGSAVEFLVEIYLFPNQNIIFNYML
ncbi:MULTISPECIES: ROK family protein [Niallia]|uniref:ROK family protein n=1 Tax=Niallia TaxID=2837506 RepID=UPI0015F707CE|nr:MULTISPECIES: ROK family protein [Niallia]UPO91207.1 ROK family protein [Niallia sp. Man26]GKU84169.1 hypothetical protein NCCP28_35650 [Niallia sp. NCCP-28]